MINDMHWQG